MPHLADFRSDTVTRPSAAMRAAMAAAEVGDDVMGEDPTVKALEAEAAAALGKAAALLVPSGTMANQLAVHVHCRPGDELICEQRSHVYFFEGGAVARLSGTQVRTLVADDGFPTPPQVEAAIRADDVHFPRTRLLVLENTHNMAGGRVASPARLGELAALAHARGLAVHIDGARLANAAVAAGVGMGELAAAADSVSLCFSKGLGAPIGSVLAGDAAFIAAARRARKAFGGGMRQAGVIAAAALLALRHGPDHLAADHARARRLAQGLADLPGVQVDPGSVETNIVMLDLQRAQPAELLAALRQRSVLAAAADPRRVRFVTHCDVGDADVDACLAAVAAFTGAAAHS